MGACSFSATSVQVQYGSRSVTLTFKNLLDLRFQIIKEFKLDNRFILLYNQKIIKSSTELLIFTKSSKRSQKIIVSYAEDSVSSSKSQIMVGKSLAVLLLNKYLLFPDWTFPQTSIETHSITIKNEEYRLKNYYLSLDVPGLALGKVKKSGRKIESLLDLEKELGDLETLSVYKESSKVKASTITNSKFMTCSLVYNDRNVPVGIMAWDNKNVIVSLNALKSSIHFGIHFTSIPEENLPASMSALNLLSHNNAFIETSALFRSNKLITFHLNDYSVNYFPVDKNLGHFSLTQTPIGYIFVSGFEVFKYNGASLHVLPRPSSTHTNHSAVHFQSLFVLISGTGITKVEGLHLHNLTWKSLPDFPVVVEHSASCAHGSSLFVMGGRVKGLPTDAVYVFSGQDWECLSWKLPWTVTGAGAFSLGNEIVVFGGVQSDKDKFVVIENGKEVESGGIGVHASFEGLSAGKISSGAVCFSRQGQIFKYDSGAKRFYLMSIGNYFI